MLFDLAVALMSASVSGQTALESQTRPENLHMVSQSWPTFALVPAIHFVVMCWTMDLVTAIATLLAVEVAMDLVTAIATLLAVEVVVVLVLVVVMVVVVTDSGLCAPKHGQIRIFPGVLRKHRAGILDPSAGLP